MRMSYFGKFYLDKEKDIVVNLDMNRSVLSYTIHVRNHKTDNIINNLAHISGQEIVIKDGRPVIAGEIPCYIKGGADDFLDRPTLYDSLIAQKILNIFCIEADSYRREKF